MNIFGIYNRTSCELLCLSLAVFMCAVSHRLTDEVVVLVLRGPGCRLGKTWWLMLPKMSPLQTKQALQEW
ncbi:hypothetical protein GCK32_012672, partial [Trichostrongylus colubriformis]